MAIFQGVTRAKKMREKDQAEDYRGAEEASGSLYT